MNPASSMLNLTDNRIFDAKFDGKGRLLFTRGYAASYLQHISLCKLSMAVVFTLNAHQSCLVSVQIVLRQTDVFKVLRDIVRFVAVNVVDGLSLLLRANECLGNQIVDVNHAPNVLLPKMHDRIPTGIDRRAFDRFLDRMAHATFVAHLIAQHLRCRLPSFVLFHEQPLSHEQTLCHHKLAAAMR